MEYRIAVIPGDGIGPEIVTEAKKVLDRVGQVFGHTSITQKWIWAAFPLTNTAYR